MFRILFIFLSLLFSLSVSAEEMNYVAVLDFTGEDIPPQLLRSTSDAAREGALDMLPPDKFTLMTRETTLQILHDMGKDASCLTGACETELLRNIQADYGVTGTIAQIDGQYEFVIRLFDSHSAQLLASETQVFSSHSEMRTAAKQMSKLLVANIPGAGLGSSVSFADITVKRMEIYRGEGIVNQPSDKMGFLIITSEPLGANILVNGESYGLAPLQRSVPEGQYVVVADMGSIYHEATSGIIEVKDDEVHNVSLKLQPSYGQLIITSDPSDAKVYISNEFVGTTPYQHEQHPSGVYNLRLEQEHYFSYQDRIIIEDLQKTKRDIKLDKAISNISVQSIPSDADIWLNGVPTGKKTPYVFENKPSGEYQIRLVKNNYKTLDQMLSVSAGQDIEFSQKLEGNFGSLIVSSIPEGATITLNGINTQETTPYTFKDQNAGLAVVELQKAGYGFEKQQVNIPNDGSSVTVQKELTAKLATLILTSTTPSGEPCIGDTYLDEQYIGKTPLKIEVIAIQHKVKVDCEGLKGVEHFELKHNDLFNLNILTQTISVQDIFDTQQKLAQARWIGIGLFSVTSVFAYRTQHNYDEMLAAHADALAVSSSNQETKYLSHMNDAEHFQQRTNRNILITGSIFAVTAAHYWWITRTHRKKLHRLKKLNQQY